ncbi:hypothetical protein BGW41_000778 [Actinomortierella wolfii]|nr:hypothetical protein BGW41_000778 [Actinomortierella wolfii]
MSQNDPWDDWEQADEASIEAPSLPAAPAKSAAMSQQTIKIMQRQSSGQMTEQEEAEAKALEEKNKALWSKANAFQTPFIERTDSTRTEYVPEASLQISILRRPKGPSTVVVPRPSPVMKPLAEREAEYKAAREKIFGPSSSPSGSSLTSPSRTPPIDGNQSGQSASSQDYYKPIRFSGVQPSLQMHPTPIMDTAVRQPRGPPSSESGPGSGPSFSRGRGGFGYGNRGSSGRPLASSSTSSEPGIPSSEEGGSRGFRRPLRGRPQAP